jgi:signal transduction histidine kinase
MSTAVSTAELVVREREPLDLRLRVEHAARTFAYLPIATLLGIVHLLALLPLLLLGSGRVWPLAELERKLANRLLHARVPPLPYRRDGTAGRPPAAVFVLLLVRLPVAVLVSLGCAVPLLLAGALARYGIAGLGTSDELLGPWTLGPAVGAVLLLLALAATVLSVAALEAAAWPLRDVVIRLISSTAHSEVAVREALAERIGDESLMIAYWLPERSVFVDEHGVPVELPERGSGRTATFVEHAGRRVAAIVHDAALDTRPELVRAAAAGAVLALENEQLKADLRARIEDLRASRARIVEAAWEAQRRIERNLHDGAQQQLVSLSLELRMLRNRVADDPDVAALVDNAQKTLTDALAELRELARGIHPAVLTDRGLAPAVETLAARTAVPVELDVSVEERFSPAVEAAVYFVVAEALTNVAKYAAATHARVTIGRDGDWLDVYVRDDGAGGADAADGSGLRGLGDRVAAVDGTFEVNSPLGEGTLVRARVPARVEPT